MNHSVEENRTALIASVKELLAECTNPQRAEPQVCERCMPMLIEAADNTAGLLPLHLLGSVYLQLGSCSFFRNQLAQAEHYFQRAQQLVDEGCNLEKAFSITYYMAFIKWKWGKLDEATELFTQILPYFQSQERYDMYAGVCMNLSSILLTQGKVEQSTDCIHKAIEGFSQTGNHTMLFQAKSNLGNVYSSQGKFDLALPIKREVIDYFTALGNERQLALEYNTLSTIYYRSNRLEEAIDYALKSVQIRERLGDLDKIAYSWINLGIYYMEFKQHELALQYYQKALAELSKEKDIVSLAQIYNNIGNLYLEAKELDKALENYTLSMNYNHESGNKFGLANVLHNIGLIYAEGNKDLDKALETMQQAANIAEEIEDLLLYATSKLEIASLQIQQNRFEDARQLLTEVEALLLENNCDSLNGRLYKTWNELYLASQDFTMAHAVLTKYVADRERTHCEAIITKIAEMQTRYETEKKEKEAEIYRLKYVELEEKNKLIEAQKKELQDTLDKLQNSEIRYNFISEELTRNIRTTLIGKSDVINNISKLISLVAKSDKTNVLITGETGTGKEIVARNIHSCSKRGKLPFYAVNCSAVPETLFESQFFGHEKDAFTGANSTKIGWFEIANRSTLFLDEIGTLSHDQQAKLLRTLEERYIVRVGSHKEIPLDVRIISATNLNLIDKVNRDEFRRDLYHRLAIFVIHIPPLRDRKEEIPLLLEHFVGISSKAMNKRINKIEKDVAKHLMDYDYPGNVRELRNMVERAVLIAESSTLRLQHFTIPISGHEAGTLPAPCTLQEMEQQLIIKTLKSTGFNRAQAAILLGVERKVVERKIKKYNIVHE